MTKGSEDLANRVFFNKKEVPIASNMPTTASKGIGIEAVLDKIIEVFEDQAKESRHVHINYGTEIEEAIARIKV